MAAPALPSGTSHSGQAMTPTISSKLESMATEITVMIMKLLPDLSSLRSLVHASPIHHGIYQASGSVIYTHIVLKQLAARDIHLTHKMDLVEICLDESFPSYEDLPWVIAELKSLHATPGRILAHPALETVLDKIQNQALSKQAVNLSVEECNLISKIKLSQGYLIDGPSKWVTTLRTGPYNAHYKHFKDNTKPCFYHGSHAYYLIRFREVKKQSWCSNGRAWLGKRIETLQKRLEMHRKQLEKEEEIAQKRKAQIEKKKAARKRKAQNKKEKVAREGRIEAA